MRALCISNGIFSPLLNFTDIFSSSPEVSKYQFYQKTSIYRQAASNSSIFTNICKKNNFFSFSLKQNAMFAPYIVNQFFFMEVNMKKNRWVFGVCWPMLFLTIILVLSGCDAEQENRREPRSLTLMTWNVHNLFDGKDDGYEYPEFLLSAGWSQEKYLGRLNTISAAICKISPLPDIIAFQEVESLEVLEELALFLPRGYSWSHFANNPRSAIGLGVLSRFPLTEAQTHTITIDNDTTPRPVLEVRVETDDSGLSIVIFICHWKSKLGGEAETEKIRRASARAIIRRSREIWENEPNIGIIVAGDLNVNHDEFYRRGRDVICSLIPDAPYSAQLAGSSQKDFIIISGNKPPLPVYFPHVMDDSAAAFILFSPWIEELENGTYFFRNNWETIDHFLLSSQFFDNYGWQYGSTELIDFEPFVNSSGRPFFYNPRTGSGLSDHLPLVLTLFFKSSCSSIQ
jgi:endonuclease/exonuclease/phosphatase family metal-dependent hydrolase